VEYWYETARLHRHRFHARLVLPLFALFSIDTYDLSLGRFGDTTERLALGWHFSTGCFDTDIIIIQKKKKAGQKIDYLSWLNPFTNEVWGMMLLTVLFSSMITWILQKLSGCHEPGKILMTRKWRETGFGRGLYNLFHVDDVTCQIFHS
jgi:hypothetical protein